MDWIDVALSGLQNLNETIKDLKNSTGLKGSLKLFHFISTIDMLRESIDSMWVAYLSGEGLNMHKHPHYPFNKSHDIFNGKLLKNPLTKCDVDNNNIYTSVSDDRYFSHLRSFFGVHSTNGDPIKYYYSKRRYYNIRLFSSWSNNFFENGKYTVMMYCNDPILEDYFANNPINYELKIDLNKIIQFALLKYRSLIILSCFIDWYKHDIYTKFKSKHLRLNKDESILNQIIYLRKFAKDTRIMSAYYDHNIDDYIKFLKLWKNMKENKYLKNSDIKSIQLYLTVLNNHIITDYYKILNTGKFIRSKYIEATDITPRYAYNHKYSWDYRHLITMGDESLDNNKFDIDLYNQCLSILIRQQILPSYYSHLESKEIYLLLLSKAYSSNHNIIDNNYDKSG